jgi:hypothetical protein
MQFAIVSQAQYARFSKVFYNPAGEMHVVASAAAGQDSLMMISGGEVFDHHDAVHLMDATGVMHWSKGVVREGSWLVLIDIVRTADQNFLICATETTTGTYKESILLIKTNVAGDMLWVKKFEDDLDVSASGIGITAGGDILVTGKALVGTSWNSKLLLLRFTADGELIWAKAYGSPALKDGGIAVAELANGHLIVGGFHKIPNSYHNEMSLTQTDAAGNVLWAKMKATPGNYPLSQISDLIADSSGFYLSGGDNEIGMVMAMNVDGGIIWSKSLNLYYSGNYESIRRGRINTTAGGDLLVSAGGPWEGDGYFYKITPDGNADWLQQAFMSPIEAQPLSDGGYLFLGLGPLMGVKDDPSQPQTGIVRTNALGEGVGCTETLNGNTEDYVPAFENLDYTVTDIGSAADYSIQWEEFPINSFAGCVTFFGAVAEIPDAANALKVFPNPGNGSFRLQLELEEIQPESLVQLTLFNSQGQRIFSREGNWSQLQMIDRQIPAGIYLINLKTEKTVFTTRLIVN